MRSPSEHDDLLSELKRCTVYVHLPTILSTKSSRHRLPGRKNMGLEASAVPIYDHPYLRTYVMSERLNLRHPPQADSTWVQRVGGYVRVCPWRS